MGQEDLSQIVTAVATSGGDQYRVGECLTKLYATGPGWRPASLWQAEAQRGGLDRRPAAGVAERIELIPAARKGGIVG